VDANQHIWRIWANKIHIWGFQGLFASLLEALGPLTILGSQALYLGEPLLQHTISKENVRALAEMLEEPAQTRAFIELLRR
jgi:hypothetical protein